MSYSRKKLKVKIGTSSLEMPLTEKQALEYGKNAMPNEQKRAGFKCTIYRSNPEIDGSDFYRIDYAK